MWVNKLNFKGETKSNQKEVNFKLRSTLSEGNYQQLAQHIASVRHGLSINTCHYSLQLQVATSHRPPLTTSHNPALAATLSAPHAGGPGPAPPPSPENAPLLVEERDLPEDMFAFEHLFFRVVAFARKEITLLVWRGPSKAAVYESNVLFRARAERQCAQSIRNVQKA